MESTLKYQIIKTLSEVSDTYYNKLVQNQELEIKVLKYGPRATEAHVATLEATTSAQNRAGAVTESEHNILIGMLKSKHSNKFEAQMDLSWGMWATLIQATKGEDKKKQMMENLPASLYNYFEPAIPTSNLITETLDTRRKEN